MRHDRVGRALGDLHETARFGERDPHVGAERELPCSGRLRGRELRGGGEVAHPCDELRHVVGLRHVVVRSGFERLDDLLLAAVGGEHQDRQRRRRVRSPHDTAHLEAAQPEELAVEDEDIGARAVRDALEHHGAVLEERHVLGDRQCAARHLCLERAVLEDPDTSAPLSHHAACSRVHLAPCGAERKMVGRQPTRRVRRIVTDGAQSRDRLGRHRRQRASSSPPTTFN
jgi:hypothetical protein